MRRRRVGVLISGRGSNMAALIAAAASADYPAQIVTVLSNRPNAAGLDHARAAGIATKAIDHKAHRDRAGFDAALDAALQEAGVEIVCLAGFMRLLTPGFTERWEGRMINIHPALLPSFKGLDTHARALAAGVRLHGCTVHFVTSEMDAGPIIMQAAVPVLDADTADTLGARVLAQEHVIYPAALRLICEGRARLDDGRVRIDDHGTGGRALVAPAA
ncbi:MAG TPA: phosphoribosylglycinamide formyltransferase [Xanthobacteraceae bacterium]|nr:phosphoribosylglycinamide formyltransferase [Xanthobacteraceae bacterium]